MYGMSSKKYQRKFQSKIPLAVSMANFKNNNTTQVPAKKSNVVVKTFIDRLPPI